MRPQLEVDIALLMRARPIRNEADAAEMRSIRKDLSQSLPHLVDPPDRGADAFGQTPGHRAGCIEDDHGVFDAWLVRLLSAARGAAPGNEHQCNNRFAPALSHNHAQFQPEAGGCG